MKRLMVWGLILLFATPCYAADVKVSALATGSGSVDSTWITICQSASSATTAKCTVSSILALGITGGTQYYLPVWTSATSFGKLASLGTAGQALQSNGSGANPSWQDILSGGTQYRLPIWSSSSSMSALASGGTAGQFLGSNGASANPSFQDPLSGGTQYRTVVWSSASSLGSVATGTAGQVLMSNGAAANPSYQDPLSGGTQYRVPIWSSSSSMSALASAGTAGQVLTSQGASANPIFTTISSTATALSAQYIDWNATSGGTSIANKPTLAAYSAPSTGVPTVATSATSTGGLVITTSFPTGGAFVGGYISASGLTAERLYYMASGGLTLAAASTSTSMPAICFSVSSIGCLLPGGVYKYSSSPAWTVGTILYTSNSTAGFIGTSAPSVAGHQVQRVGVAIAADTLLFLPSMDVGGL